MDNIAIIVSVAAFATAVLGPLITASIQCSHESKMYNKRFYEEHKQQVIENYLKAVGKFAFTTDWNEKLEFGEASAEIFMYTPKELWDNIRELNKQISDYTTSSDDYSTKKEYQKKLLNNYFELCEKFHMINRRKGLCKLSRTK